MDASTPFADFEPRDGTYPPDFDELTDLRRSYMKATEAEIEWAMKVMKETDIDDLRLRIFNDEPIPEFTCCGGHGHSVYPYSDRTTKGIVTAITVGQSKPVASLKDGRISWASSALVKSL